MARMSHPAENQRPRLGSSWFASVERFRRRFPSLLRTDFWRASGVKAFFNSLRGEARRTKRGHKLSLAGFAPRGFGSMVEALESRQMLAADLYVDDDYTPSTIGWNVDHFATIQNALTAA